MKNLELKKKFQNKYMIRMAAGVLTVAVLGSGTGMAYTVHAEKKGKEVKNIFSVCLPGNFIPILCKCLFAFYIFNLF